MLSSVSSFIKKSLPLKLTNGDAPDQAGRGQESSQRPGDRVEDGFLLVGNTASERTTVYTSSFQANRVDCPPGYLDVCIFLFLSQLY